MKGEVRALKGLAGGSVVPGEEADGKIEAAKKHLGGLKRAHLAAEVSEDAVEDPPPAKKIKKGRMLRP